MEFRIKRTSTFALGAGDPEVEGAYQKKDERNWYIQINSLEELIKLEEKEGNIIVGDGYIEIYDTYRE